MMSKYFKNFILCGDADYYCLICQELYHCIPDVEKHIRWEKHRKELKCQTFFPKYRKEFIYKVANKFYCAICNTLSSDIAAITKHINEESHKAVKINPKTEMKNFIGQYIAGCVKINKVKLNLAQWNSIINKKCLLCNIGVRNAMEHRLWEEHVIKLIQSETSYENERYYRKINDDQYHCFTCKKVFSALNFNDHWPNCENIDGIEMDRNKETPPCQNDETVTEGTSRTTMMDIENPLNGTMRGVCNIEEVKYLAIWNCNPYVEVEVLSFYQHTKIANRGNASEGSTAVTEETEEKDEEQAPEDEAQAPEYEAQAPEDVAQAPEEEAQAPEYEAQAPGDEAQLPEDDGQAPEDEAQNPEDEAQAPEYEAQAPGDEAQAPEDEAQAPEYEAQGPEDEAQGPEDEAQGPEDEAQAPEDEAQAPEDEAQAPEDEAQAPEDEVQAPEYEAQAPGDEAQGPEDEAQGPEEEAQAPEYEAQALGDEAQDPEDAAQAPEDEARAPEDEEVIYVAIVDHGKQRTELAKYGKAHSIKLNHNGSKGWCLLCDRYISAYKSNFEQHLNGATHKGNLELQKHPNIPKKHDYKTNNVWKCLAYVHVEKKFWVNNDSIIDVYSFFLLHQINDPHFKKTKCYTCVELFPQGQEREHCETMKHRNNFMAAKFVDCCEMSIGTAEFIREIRPNFFHCGFCNQTFPFLPLLQKHLKSLTHESTTKENKIGNILNTVPIKTNSDDIYAKLLHYGFGNI